jgi:hypothetical protein
MTSRTIRRARARRGRPLPEAPSWDRGTDPRHPDPAPAERLFGAYYTPPAAELVKRGKVIHPYRPPGVRIVGPIVGSITTFDPALIRREARRLLDVAATVEALQAAYPPATLDLVP